MDTTSQPEGTFSILFNLHLLLKGKKGEMPRAEMLCSKGHRAGKKQSSDWKTVCHQETGTLLRVKEVLTETIGINQVASVKQGRTIGPPLSLREASEL